MTAPFLASDTECGSASLTNQNRSVRKIKFATEKTEEKKKKQRKHLNHLSGCYQRLDWSTICCTARKIIFVISGGQLNRKGTPTVPMPRVT